MKSLSDLGWLCYENFMQAGRLPEEIDGTDVCTWLRVCAWRAARRQKRKQRRVKRRFIDEVMK